MVIMSDNVYDIDTRKPVKPEIPADASLLAWLNVWKKYIKDNKATALAIIGVDEEGITFCDTIGSGELDLLKLYREADTLKLIINDKLDPIIDVELDEEEGE